MQRLWLRLIAGCLVEWQHNGVSLHHWCKKEKNKGRFWIKCKRKGKAKEEYLYSAIEADILTKCSDMDHTVLLANYTTSAFSRRRHPNRASRHLIAAYYSFMNPKSMKGWVGLIGWLVADGLFTQVVTHRMQVERRTRKVCRRKTGILPLCQATNQNDEHTLNVGLRTEKRTNTLQPHATQQSDK